MENRIKVALLGLGEMGESFAEHLLEMIQEYGKPVEIVAVADRHLDSPVALGFAQNGVPVFENALDVVQLGERIDIIFDLSGDPKVTQAVRIALLAARNNHTLVAPQIFADLLWHFFAQRKPVLKLAAQAG